MTEVCDRVLRAGGPALLFEKPKGYSMPVLGNLFGTLERIALAMGVEAGASPAPALREIGTLLAALREPDPPRPSRCRRELPQLARLAGKVFDMAPKRFLAPPARRWSGRARTWTSRACRADLLAMRAGPLITGDLP